MKPYFEEDGIVIYHGDCREVLPQLEQKTVMCCVTSPPYWGLRDYGPENQIGLEASYSDYIENLRQVFSAVRDRLHEDGTLWLNLGDCYYNGDKGGYRNGRVGGSSRIQATHLHNDFIGAPNRQPQAGLKPKDLVGIPWRVAFELQRDGWWLRSDIIWHKPNPMPESVEDRPTKAHEYLFLLSKREQYFCNMAAIKEASNPANNRQSGSIRREVPPGSPPNGWDGPRVYESRNKRTVWTVPTENLFPQDHAATYPEDLIKPCVLVGSPGGCTVLDPFCGAGTTLAVARANHNRAIGIEIEEKYCEIAAKRLSQKVFQFSNP